MGIEFYWPPGATPIDPDETAELIPSLTTQGEVNEFEAHNILEATFWATRSTAIRKRLLEQKTLRLLHKQMFGKTWRWAGLYRQTQKNIGCEAWQIASLTNMLLDDIVLWLEFGTYPPEEIAARFHHRLVWIHPFINGNGRFARLATDLLCAQKGWAIPTWGSADLVEASDTRIAYIQALRAADAQDLGKLLRFMQS